MTKVLILFSLFSFFWLNTIQANEKLDYTIYHKRVVDAETFIASENYTEALAAYEDLFDHYEFIFLRDYQIATQLALYLNKEQKAKFYLLKGMESGWEMKSIRKNNFLNKLKDGKDWKSIKKQYRILNKQYESKLDLQLRKSVKKMFSKDQWKAFGALFTLSSNAQDRYAERKFAPHSEKQIAKFLKIMNASGYPGEKLIGNEFWMSTILSHHNSISTAYNRTDTLYQSIKPKLKVALMNGQISAFAFAMIEAWYSATTNPNENPIYGILDAPLEKDLVKTNLLRAKMYLRSIEVHNKLVDIEEKTGMYFYLDGHPWTEGKIDIRH